MFRKYHYLNTDLHQAAAQYVGVWNGQLVCHTGVIQFPMRKGWKRVHRLVVLPDYQGVGIGTKFIAEIGRMYLDKGMEFNLTTTTPSLVNALRKDSRWILKRYGRDSDGLKGFSRYGKSAEHLTNAASGSRITYSFWLSKE